MTIWILMLLAGGFVLPAIASDPIPAPKQRTPIALTGGTIYTVSGDVIEGGTIVFDKGKITAIGRNVRIPDNAERIDVSGKQIYPGLVDAFSNMGMSEIGSVRGTLDMSETGTINPNVRAEVTFHPESELIPVARSGGVTIAVSTPLGGTITGTSAAMMLDGWTWEDATLKAPVGLVVLWPSMVYVESPYRRQSKEEWLKERNERLQELSEAFANARAYIKGKDSETTKGIPAHDSDVRWESLRPVLNREIPVIVAASELTEIQSAIAWAEKEQVEVVIAGGRDAWRVAEILKSKDIPVLLTNIHSGPPRRWEPYDLVFSLPEKLRAAGVRFCISGDYDASNARNLPHHAATAAAYGLPADEALKAITLYPAQILRLDDAVGSLEVGKDATLIVSSGDILDLSSRVERVFIQGKKIDLRDKHKQLYNKYKEKYNQLREDTQ